MISCIFPSYKRAAAAIAAVLFFVQRNRFCFVFIFLFRRARITCEPKDSNRGGSTAQNQLSQTKVTAQKHLKFRSSLFKGLWESKGQSPWSLPQERNFPAHSNRASKSNSKAKQNYKIKKRNAAERGKTKRCNENYYLGKTVNLHCANSNE